MKTLNKTCKWTVTLVRLKVDQDESRGRQSMHSSALLKAGHLDL